MSKRGLGKGLQALISDDNNDDSSIKEIFLSDIEPNPDQPRKDFNDESLNELADSLKTHGLLQPIMVRPVGTKYYIIAGERRYRAAKIAGFEKITCLVHDCSEQASAEKAIIENIQRSDLSPIEEGLAYNRLMNEYGLTQEQVAKRVGKGRPTIANLLRVIQLPEPVLNLLRSEEISLGHAKLLVAFDDTSLQVIIAQKAAKEKLSVRETEDLIKNINSNNSSSNKEKTKRHLSMSLKNIEEKIQNYFQTKVKLKGNNLKGKVEIEYFSEDELNRLLELWNIEID